MQVFFCYFVFLNDQPDPNKTMYFFLFESPFNLFFFDTKEVKQTLGDYLTSLTEVTPLSSAAKAKQRVGGGCSILVH